MKKRILFSLPVIILLGLITAAEAVQITSVLSNLGGNNYEYSYTVTNNDISGGLSVFDIYFPAISSSQAFNYSNITEIANPNPTNWLSTIFPPSAPNLGAIYDVEAQITPLPLGSSLSGFEVSFTYTGSAALGPQYFEIYDSSYNLLETGGTSVAVPEPGTMMLLATGLFGLIGFRRWAKR